MSTLVEHMKPIIAIRKAHRDGKDYEFADKIRESLLSQFGIVLQDHKDGTTTWKMNYLPLRISSY